MAALAAAWGCRARWACAGELTVTQWAVHLLAVWPLDLVVRAVLRVTLTEDAGPGGRARDDPLCSHASLVREKSAPTEPELKRRRLGKSDA